MKPCSRCQVPKPLSEFRPEKRSADGHRYSCRQCDRIASRARHAKNKAVKNLAARDYYQKNREKCLSYGTRYRQRFVWRTILQHAKKRAEKFNLEYDLDTHLGEIKSRLAPMVCEMTGVTLVPGVGAGSAGKRFWNTPSLDRIDSKKGYTIDNVRIVCWAMNAAMGTWGEGVLREIVVRWLGKVS